MTTASANAAAAEAEAKQIMAQARENAKRRRVLATEQTSTQIAKVGASGMDILGSPLDVIFRDVARGELAAQDILYQGKVGYAAKDYEAQLRRYQAGLIIPSTLLNIGGDLVSSQAKSGKTLFGQPLGNP
jgi:hypothetical protein